MNDGASAGPKLVLVTGATGFLGRAVVRRLADRCTVRAASREAATVEGAAERVRLDLVTGEGLSDACHDADAVIHCAGLAHQFRGEAAEAFHAVNVTGTARVVNAAVDQRVSRLVIASSISVYGRTGGVRTEDSLCLPETAYGRSKLDAEQVALRAVQGSSTTLVILRLATLFGPGDPGNVARLTESIRRRRFVPVGAGRNRKSLLHCQDAAEAVLAALEWTGAPQSSVFNVSAQPVAMREVLCAATRAVGRQPYRWHVPAGPALFAAHLVGAVGPANGRMSALAGTLEKYLSEDVVDSARFHSATGFSARRQLSDGTSLEPGVD